MTDFKIGQKWISNAEPELAMGRIIRLEDRTLSVYFDGAGEERTYARKGAPLSRVRFSRGDRVATQDGIVLTIETVVDRDGIFIYHGDYRGTSTAVMETELDPNVRFSNPKDRLFTYQLDENAWFNLRYASRQQLSRLSTSRHRGLFGPRTSLVPHQLYIAFEVASRHAPRVLLADEVGLGKTIEAGLIMHQQLLTGRAARVLIIVPAALTFQWFVEMIRRFSLQFTVLDEARCQEITADNTSEAILDSDIEESLNPFEAQQLMLCNLDLFQRDKRLAEALEAGWDLVIVDEAHHLRWDEDTPSVEYQIVEQFSRVSPGLLLLTATPEQLGRAGHFARLRLLDPNRFHSFAAFVAEEQEFEAVARAANALLTGDAAARDAARQEIRKRLNSDAPDDDLVRQLLDRHGTGRILFRNVRSAIQGFPERLCQPAGLALPEKYRGSLDDPFPETGFTNWTSFDPRVAFLVELAGSMPEEKILVICARQQTAVSLEGYLSHRVALRTTLFHEGMTLVARDRAANYFAETERGAQLLICSEIGSEGRNFQFASHLVLFDLPPGPDLLEQRIGRLDRIGQKNDVVIHVPYLEQTRQELLFHLFDTAFDLFRQPNPVAQAVFETLDEAELRSVPDDLVTRVAEITELRLAELARGRDRLLELNSHDRDVSSALVADIQAEESDRAVEDYMEQSFELFGLESEHLSEQLWLIRPTDAMQRHAPVSAETSGRYYYPELPEDGIRVTYNRETALAREDVNFFTWENPIVQQALDAAVSDVSGNCTMIAVRHPRLKAGTLLVEVVAIAECPAPAELQAERYLPPRILRRVISPNLNDVTDRLPYQTFDEEQLEVPPEALHQIIESQADGIKKMLAAANSSIQEELKEIVSASTAMMRRENSSEQQRLLALMEVNSNVRSEEIDYLTRTIDDLESAFENASARIDAIRVIVAA